MEMTIDDAIETLKDTNSYGTADIAKSVAIETMRKYQQIEEIYKNWCYPTYFNATDAMNKLGEVLKDGNVD